MRDDQKTEFVKILMGLAAIKPGGNMLTKESYEIWWNAMRDWTLEDFRAAASHLAKTTEFMPSPFQFHKLRKAGQPTAHEAWAEAVAASRNTYQITQAGANYDGRATSGNALIDRVVRTIGGYKAIAMADIEKDFPHIRRRFIEAYEQISEVEETREQLTAIAYQSQEAIEDRRGAGLLPVLTP